MTARPYTVASLRGERGRGREEGGGKWEELSRERDRGREGGREEEGRKGERERDIGRGAICSGLTLLRYICACV